MSVFSSIMAAAYFILSRVQPESVWGWIKKFWKRLVFDHHQSNSFNSLEGSEPSNFIAYLALSPLLVASHHPIALELKFGSTHDQANAPTLVMGRRSWINSLPAGKRGRLSARIKSHVGHLQTLTLTSRPSSTS